MTENLIPEENLNVKKSHFFLFFLILAVLLAGLTGLVFLGGKKNVPNAATTAQKTPITPIPIKSVNAQTVLSFSPSQQTGVIQEAIKTSIIVNPGNNKLSAVQLVLKYDPKIVEVIDIAPGNFFTSPTVLAKKIDQQKGQIEFALGSLTPPTTNNVLATLSFKLISSTSTPGTKITFSPDTKIADINEGSNNVLKSATDLTVNILQK